MVIWLCVCVCCVCVCVLCVCVLCVVCVWVGPGKWVNTCGKNFCWSHEGLYGNNGKG